MIKAAVSCPASGRGPNLGESTMERRCRPRWATWTVRDDSNQFESFEKQSAKDYKCFKLLPFDWEERLDDPSWGVSNPVSNAALEVTHKGNRSWKLDSKLHTVGLQNNSWKQMVLISCLWGSRRLWMCGRVSFVIQNAETMPEAMDSFTYLWLMNSNFTSPDFPDESENNGFESQ